MAQYHFKGLEFQERKKFMWNELTKHGGYSDVGFLFRKWLHVVWYGAMSWWNVMVLCCGAMLWCSVMVQYHGAMLRCNVMVQC